jgi:hypothetical protein
MNWVLTPPWSVRVIVMLAAVLGLITLFRWWRERRGAALVLVRLLVLAALVTVILNPQALLPREQSGKPKLIVLLDTSSSMSTRDVAGDSRLAAATRALTNNLARLNNDFVLDLRRFDRETRPLDVNQFSRVDLGDASDLSAALMHSVSDLGEQKAQAGVLLIADGRATTPGALEAAQLALARSVPLWTYCLGGAVPRHDLWIETASSEALAFSGAEVELAATLHAAGYPNRSFKVEVVKDDKVIETQEVVPDTNGAARVTVRVKAPDSGEHRYVFRVPAEQDEGETLNNERAIFLRSVGEKVRVLVAEGQPHWDTKFLVQSLKRDPHVDVTAVYRISSTRHLAVVSTAGNETRVEKDLFPRTADAMNAFDIIVLGRGAEAFFDPTTEQLLTDFVAKRAGSVVFARGKPYGGRFQPLAKFEPVAWGEGNAPTGRLRPTEAARDNPIFDLGASGNLEDLLDRLPALDQSSVTLGEKPLSIVLATSADADGPAILAYQRYGQGKALSLNAGGLWRWSFREAGQDESENAYRRFWISLLQWLLSGGQFLPGAEVALTSSRRYYTSEQPLQFMIATRNIDRTIYQPKLLISGGGREVEVEPRARGEMFVAEAGPFPPGTYRVNLKNNVGKPSELSQSVEVISASVEKRELSADRELMRQLAETSGGAVVNADDVARMGDVVKRWEAARQLAHRQRPVWDRWWVLGTMLVLLGTEWWLRRREGLL